MIVAFGFTGVSTSLTVMSDVEVLDITTWSWTSYYVPSPGYPGSGDTHGINGGGNTLTLPGTPSMAIVAGAVTGGLVVFILIIVALYIFNFQQKQRHTPSLQSAQDAHDTINDESTILPPSNDNHHHHLDPFTRTISRSPSSAPTPPISPISPSSPTSPVSPISSISAPPHLAINHHHQQQQPRKRTNSLLPSPWKDYQSSHWFVKRASTTSGLPHNTTTHFTVSKPDEPGGFEKAAVIHRAITVPGSSPPPPPHISITQLKYKSSEKIQNDGNHHGNDKENGNMDSTDKTNDNIAGGIDNDNDNDNGFDRQEFILHSGEISSDQNTVGCDSIGHSPLDKNTPPLE
ncbi:hypothetical protein BC941DRAFT_428679 [Chlamydoabsidia padenii]|nr:hypothetical protein BC941DRAFT_428679 [Chlamydoabsidia padenii]